MTNKHSRKIYHHAQEGRTDRKQTDRQTETDRRTNRQTEGRTADGHQHSFELQRHCSLQQRTNPCSVGWLHTQTTHTRACIQRPRRREQSNHPTIHFSVIPLIVFAALGPLPHPAPPQPHPPPRPRSPALLASGRPSESCGTCQNNTTEMKPGSQNTN